MVEPTSLLSGCDLVRQEASKYSDWDINIMVAISHAESGCVADNDNTSSAETHRDYYGNAICVGSYGAMQIGCVHYQQDPQALDNLELNISVAHSVWLKQGYSAWTMYNNGKYLKFL